MGLFGAVNQLKANIERSAMQIGNCW